jgi:hypothetical protein
MVALLKADKGNRIYNGFYKIHGSGDRDNSAKYQTKG